MKKISDQTKANVARMYQEGSLLKDIAEQNNICIQSIDNIVNALNISRDRLFKSRQYDYNEVIELYKKGNTVREVADLIGGNHRRVAEIVKNAGVSRKRTIRSHILEKRAKKCPAFSSSFIEYLDGLIISDGCLTKPTLANTSHYQQTCVHHNWLIYIQKVFLENGVESSVRPYNRKGKQSGWVIQSSAYDQFFNQYQRWYGQEKQVPKDLSLTPACLKNWIYGDGTLVKTGLRFCCDSFSLESVDWLISQFKAKGFIFNRVFMGLAKSGKDKWRISLCKKNGLEAFYQYIGDCDVDCFSYKWYKNK